MSSQTQRVPPERPFDAAQGRPELVEGRGAASSRTQLAFIVAIAALYVLHQDYWLWREARPLFAGFLPVGLTYHAAYCVAAAVLMWALTSWAWPSHLEEAVPGQDRRR